MTIETSSGQVGIVNSAGQIDPGVRAQMFAAHALDGRYYEVVEETLRDQFDFRYAVLKNRDTGDSVVQPFWSRL